MKEALADAWHAHLRLSILRLLREAPGYALNDSLITDCIGDIGIAATRDQVRVCLAWLSEQGLVTLDAEGRVGIATLTERGGDVATGRAACPGVKRPSPR